VVNASASVFSHFPWVPALKGRRSSGREISQTVKETWQQTGCCEVPYYIDGNGTDHAVEAVSTRSSEHCDLRSLFAESLATFESDTANQLASINCFLSQLPLFKTN